VFVYTSAKCRGRELRAVFYYLVDASSAPDRAAAGNWDDSNKQRCVAPAFGIEFSSERFR